MEHKLSSGSALVDELLAGGYERDALTCIYGPPGSGKTTLAMLALIHAAREGKKVVYIDTEGNFSIERFRQLAPGMETLEHVIFLKPIDFDGQAKAFEKLRQITDPRRVALIILDGAAMLYRLELGKNRDVYSVNREFGVQLSYLTEIARTHHIPVLITNQVYADLDHEGNVKIVGGDILRYASKCLLEVKRLAGGNRLLIVRKHRALPEDASAAFKIVQGGIERVQLQQTPTERQYDDFQDASALQPPAQ